MTLGAYNVFYEDSEWKVKRDGASKASASFDRKSDAERRANALASRRNETVVLHRKDGTIQSEYRPR